MQHDHVTHESHDSYVTMETSDLTYIRIGWVYSGTTERKTDEDCMSL